MRLPEGKRCGPRDFIALIGGSVAAWPSALPAQPAERTRVVGALISAGNNSRSQANLSQLRSALQDLGWTEGRNIRLEVRWAEGEVERVRAFAVELAQLSPDVILAAGTSAIATLKHTTQRRGISDMFSRSARLYRAHSKSSNSRRRAAQGAVLALSLFMRLPTLRSC